LKVIGRFDIDSLFLAPTRALESDVGAEVSTYSEEIMGVAPSEFQNTV
jgi:hypothetical protein